MAEMGYDGVVVQEPRCWVDQMDWAGLRQEVETEARAEIALLGLVQSGKSTLFNSLRGWPVPTDGLELIRQDGAIEEPMGLFTLIDLPEDGHLEDGLLERLDRSSLLVYLLDGAAGCAQAAPAAAIVRPADSCWISRLRATGRPLLVALNKADVWADETDAIVAAVEKRLGTAVVPVSAYDSSEARGCFLDRMVEACPELAVPLGREIAAFRHDLALQLIRRASILCGLVATEPVPLVDLPVQVGAQVGLVARIAAVYDRPPSSDYSKELVFTGAGSVALRMLAQQAAKAVPVLGWAVSGLLAATATWVVGQTALAYFEGRATPARIGHGLAGLWRGQVWPFCTWAVRSFLHSCPAARLLRRGRALWERWEGERRMAEIEGRNAERRVPQIEPREAGGRVQGAGGGRQDAGVRKQDAGCRKREA